MNGPQIKPQSNSDPEREWYIWRIQKDSGDIGRIDSSTIVKRFINERNKTNYTQKPRAK